MRGVVTLYTRQLYFLYGAPHPARPTKEPYSPDCSHTSYLPVASFSRQKHEPWKFELVSLLLSYLLLACRRTRRSNAALMLRVRLARMYIPTEDCATLMTRLSSFTAHARDTPDKNCLGKDKQHAKPEVGAGAVYSSSGP